MIGVRTKDPADIRIYTINWAPWLLALGTTISTSSWTVVGGIIDVQDTYTNTTSTVKISGGVANTDYTAINTVLTVSGETKRVSFVLRVRIG